MISPVVSSTEPLVIRLAGKLDEDADMDFFVIPKGDPIELDLSELTSVKSEGIRNFKSWIGKLADREIHFSYCPRVFIDQVNMIDNFLPFSAKIISFYVPYFGPQTNEERMILYVREQDYYVENGDYTLKEKRVLDSAGNHMAIDVPQRYFNFLGEY